MISGIVTACSDSLKALEAIWENALLQDAKEDAVAAKDGATAATVLIAAKNLQSAIGA